MSEPTPEMIAEVRGFFADETDHYIPSETARRLCSKILTMKVEQAPSRSDDSPPGRPDTVTPSSQDTDQ